MRRSTQHYDDLKEADETLESLSDDELDHFEEIVGRSDDIAAYYGVAPEDSFEAIIETGEMNNCTLDEVLEIIEDVIAHDDKDNPQSVNELNERLRLVRMQRTAQARDEIRSKVMMKAKASGKGSYVHTTPKLDHRATPSAT